MMRPAAANAVHPTRFTLSAPLTATMLPCGFGPALMTVMGGSVRFASKKSGGSGANQRMQVIQRYSIPPFVVPPGQI